jgi:Arc/MetJ family transcription regulator
VGGTGVAVGACVGAAQALSSRTMMTTMTACFMWPPKIVASYNYAGGGERCKWVSLACNAFIKWWISHGETIHKNMVNYTHRFKLEKEKAMRTNVVLDEALVDRAQKLTGIRTKREVIHVALKTLVRLQEQAETRTLRGKLRWEGDLAELRQGRIDAGG